MVKVLFVCMGNICRSPTAHGVFQKLVIDKGLVSEIFVDSAGTHAFHVSEAPDRRAQQTAAKRGVDLSTQSARRVTSEDFEEFDYVLAMDSDNYRHLEAICPEGKQQKLKLFMEYAPHLGELEVPDPYYGGINGFERVFDMVETAAHGLLKEIRRTHL